MLGRLLTHDDQKSDKELAGAFEATSEMWAAAHGGTPYVWRANHVDHRHYGFCGSCGWGEELFHSNLGHREVEATQVEAVYGSSRRRRDRRRAGRAEPAGDGRAGRRRRGGPVGGAGLRDGLGGLLVVVGQFVGHRRLEQLVGLGLIGLVGLVVRGRVWGRLGMGIVR